MKRDLDLVRKVLLAIEENEDATGRNLDKLLLSRIIPAPNQGIRKKQITRYPNLI